MNDIKEIVKDIERDLVINLILSVKYKRIKLKDAKVIAREFMASYPYGSEDDLYEKIDYLSDRYRLVRKIFVKYVPAYKDRLTKRKINDMRRFLRMNDIEGAISISKSDSSLNSLTRKEAIYG